MSDETLLTLRQLAEQLDLPESTVRYYRDAFLDQIPSIGSGRRRRYPPQAVEVLRSIARGYAAGRPKGEIVAAIHQRGPRPSAVAVPAPQASATRTLDEVTNLDLLAAIVDGEREQREALWQMATEIVRLTDVLEGQDKVLNEIASQAGVTIPALAAGHAKPQLSAGTAAAAPEPAPPPVAAPATATAEPEPVPVPTASWTSTAPETAAVADAPAPAPAAPAWTSGPTDMERLREELEAERTLVERLREAKLQLEHRAADAEAALHDKRRSSVMRRLFGADETP